MLEEQSSQTPENDEFTDEWNRKIETLFNSLINYPEEAPHPSPKLIHRWKQTPAKFRLPYPSPEKVDSLHPLVIPTPVKVIGKRRDTPFHQLSALDKYDPLHFVKTKWNGSDWLSLIVRKWLPWSSNAGRHWMLSFITTKYSRPISRMHSSSVELWNELASEHGISVTSTGPCQTMIPPSKIKMIRNEMWETEKRILEVLTVGEDENLEDLKKILFTSTMIEWTWTRNMTQDRRLLDMIQAPVGPSPPTLDTSAATSAIDWAISRRNARIVAVSIAKKSELATLRMSVVETLHASPDFTWINCLLEKEAALGHPFEFLDRTVPDLIPEIRGLLPLEEPVGPTVHPPSLDPKNPSFPTAAAAMLFPLAGTLKDVPMVNTLTAHNLFLLLTLVTDHRYHHFNEETQVCHLNINRIIYDILRPEFAPMVSTIPICSTLGTSMTTTPSTTSTGPEPHGNLCQWGH